MTVTGVRCWQVDAFTNRPFGGNPAAICWLESQKETSWMQAVAAEMNLSETAFVRRLDDGLELKWFTPKVEVDLCGHATLATAHALWTDQVVPRDQPLRFHTRSGLLTCRLTDHQFIELDFPATPPTEIQPDRLLIESLGATPRYTGSSRFYQLAVFDDPQIVRNVQPDYQKMARLPTLGVIVSAASDESGFDFISRFFAPAMGVDEDPVCGSAHCCLTPYWAARLGKNPLMAHQVSTRGGVLRVRLEGDRVILGGQAVIISRGECFC